ncbi:MAG: hypothetical protein IJQ81_11290 [Oscillibacter sp.]|nr:hypothetical protein [Oscillibacter sp.]
MALAKAPGRRYNLVRMGFARVRYPQSGNLRKGYAIRKAGISGKKDEVERYEVRTGDAGSVAEGIGGGAGVGQRTRKSRRGCA